jgi:hypothetical protein
MKRTLTSIVLVCAAAVTVHADDAGTRASASHAVMVDEDFFSAGSLCAAP